MKTITITLPDFVEVSGMSDAPASLLTVKTDNWNEAFCIAALTQGVSLKMRNTWSVGKKDIAKAEATHKSLEAGDWNQRERTGASAQKFDEAIKKLNIQALAGKLTREQLIALAAVIAPDGEVKF